MTDFIVDKFNEIVYNACERYGRENELSGDKMQILFRLNEEDDVEYDLLREYKKVKNLTFNEILNVKIDFRGYSMIVPSFIKQTLKSYSEQLETSPTNLSVMCVIAEKKVVLCLYKGFDFVKQISLEEEL
jgi:hypothetical protein